MSNNIVLKRGLDIPICGEAARKVVKTVRPDIISIKPTDFKGFAARLLVREGDRVMTGSPVMADKNCPDILVTSPVSGVVEAIVRGEKRKLLEVRVKADESQESVDFGRQDAAGMDAAAVKSLLMKSGLWMGLVQRPYGVIANPQSTPKAIFISAFNTAPLAADNVFTLGDRIPALQAGVDALSRLAPIHLCIPASDSPFAAIKGATIHTVTGPHPAGNVGVQISHIDPIRKDETVWTLSLLTLSFIGNLLLTGKLDLTRKVAVTGPVAVNPAYVELLPGTPVKELAAFYDNSAADVRFVGGDVLSGKNLGENGSLGFFDDQVTLLHEGTERELLGWAKPFRFGKFSASRSYFSWLCPKKKYAMDTNTNGGPRAFVVSDVYGKVLPMDLFPVYLIKACLAGAIEKMEQFGIYEVLPEDFALCEYVDPSKNDIQQILSDGIDLMIKEMA